jgi:hypothetical protein
MDYNFRVPIPRWYHVTCFVEEREELGFEESAEALHGFCSLRRRDREELLCELPRYTAPSEDDLDSD